VICRDAVGGRARETTTRSLRCGYACLPSLKHGRTEGSEERSHDPQHTQAPKLFVMTEKYSNRGLLHLNASLLSRGSVSVVHSESSVEYCDPSEDDKDFERAFSSCLTDTCTDSPRPSCSSSSARTRSSSSSAASVNARSPVSPSSALIVSSIKMPNAINAVSSMHFHTFSISRPSVLEYSFAIYACRAFSNSPLGSCCPPGKFSWAK
jgi:hypothetical protein